MTVGIDIPMGTIMAQNNPDGSYSIGIEYNEANKDCKPEFELCTITDNNDIVHNVWELKLSKEAAIALCGLLETVINDAMKK